MNKEIVFLLVVLAIIIVILGFLWFTGRKALVYKIMEKIEFIYHSEYGQKKTAEGLILLREFIDKKFGRFPIIKNLILFCLPERYVTKTMVKLAPKINTYVKPLAQLAKEKTAEKVIDKFAENLNLEETTPNNLLGFAENLKVQAKDKGFFVAEAGLTGNTERKGVDYYGKAGLGVKF
ncbi:MAG: hypothetical protein JW924_12025 [Fusobacteriaceae bacterium]|nr:hypothetical protein [Fusobacteriaceae bacterium]